MCSFLMVYIIIDVSTYKFYTIPLYQSIYMIFLITFLLNFNLLYSSNTPIFLNTPYITSRLKLTGFVFFVSVVSFCYAYLIDPHTA